MEKHCITFNNLKDYQDWLKKAKLFHIISSFVYNDLIVVTYTEEEIPHF